MERLGVAIIGILCSIAGVTTSCDFLNGATLNPPDGNCDPLVPTIKPNDSDDSIPPPLQFPCPLNIHVSWLDRPPFIFKNDSLPNHTSPVGLFVDVIKSSLYVCCRRNWSPLPNISFDEVPAKNITELHLKVQAKSKLVEGSMIMPVSVEPKTKYFGMLHAVSVLQTPGQILLLDKARYDMEEQSKVWRSVEGVWLVIALSILLSLVAGACIWALDTMWNPDEFPNSFGRGTTEGFWWAFVTMTTVGYGDRTPKSLFGRLFGVVWIVFGISLCSVMTATITTALISANGKQMDVDIIDKKIAVLADDSNSIGNAVKHFATPRVFGDYESMSDALVRNEVDGILIETNAGIYRLKTSNNTMHIGKVFKGLHNYGFAFWNKSPTGQVISPFSYSVTKCLSDIFEYRRNDVDVLLEKQLQRRHRKIKGKEMVGLFSMKSPLFKKLLIILSALCGFILVCILVEQLCFQRCKTTDKSKTPTATIEEAENEDKMKSNDSVNQRNNKC